MFEKCYAIVLYPQATTDQIRSKADVILLLNAHNAILSDDVLLTRVRLVS